MSHHKNFNNESQDARRRDKHNEVHPSEKNAKHHDKSGQHSHSSTTSHKSKK